MAGERILVVDDEDQIRVMMALALKRQGYQVESAQDGMHALAILRSQAPFAVLLTDLMMPEISGNDLLREARRLEPHIEAVVISAAGTIESAISAMRADGAYDYLVKPLESMAALTLAIERAVAHRQLVLEREALQAQVQAEAKRLRAFVTHTGDAILAADAQGILTIVNPAAVELLDRQDLTGCPALDYLPPVLSALITNWQTIGGQQPAAIELPWPGGSYQLINLTPMTTPAGEQQGWLMVMRDITHLKNLDDLKTRLLAESVRKIQKPLAQAVTALAELNYLAAQDERLTPALYRLTSVWESIQEWGNELTGLADLDGRDIRLVELDLNTLLETVREDVSSGILRDPQLKLTIDLPPALPKVRGDPALLRRLMQGLLKRAATRSIPSGDLRVQAHQQADQVWVVVSDSGPALSQADMLHLFEKSFINLTADLLNTGLELATVKAILDRMGGQVWMGGQGAWGSVVTVCLPAVLPT